jgi:hypothetical protein
VKGAQGPVSQLQLNYLISSRADNMTPMGGADAFMLSNETASAYMHTFKIAILDPSTDPEGWNFDKWRTDFSNRLHLVPLFRWKHAPSPLRLNHPMWVDDPEFNLNHYLRRVACPLPGDHKALKASSPGVTAIRRSGGRQKNVPKRMRPTSLSFYSMMWASPRLAALAA